MISAFTTLAANLELDACARLASAFPRPGHPRSEAWFLSDDRREYSELHSDLCQAGVARLEEVLAEIAGGTAAFGPRTEWRDWFHYLLPHLAARAASEAQGSLAQLLATAFFSQYPLGIVAPPYQSFRDDVLATLGRVLFRAWSREARAAPGFRSSRLTSLSAALALHLKYCPTRDVRPLVTALLADRSPVRRIECLAWLVGAHGLLSGAMLSLSDLPTDSELAVGWEWSHCLSMEGLCQPGVAVPFIPEENGTEAIEQVRSTFGANGLLAWVAPIEGIPALATILPDLMGRIWDLYDLREPMR